MKPSELNNHDFGQEIGRIYNDCRSFESAGLAIRAYLALETPQPSELEALRAEVSRTAAVVQAMLASRISFTEETLEKETWRLDALRTLQVAIDPIFKTPQPTQETNT